MEQGNEDGRRNSLLFYLNGKKVIHTIQNTNETLLEYLRSPRMLLYFRQFAPVNAKKKKKEKKENCCGR
jgi:hypothetical protein